MSDSIPLPNERKTMDDFDLDYSVVYDRDLAQDWAMTRMADAEMGDL